MTNEIFEKARECKSADELLALAKKNGYDITAEEAAAKFAELNNEGELSDDELDSAAGGACHRKDGRMVVTVFSCCDLWICKGCGLDADKHNMDVCPTGKACNTCKYISYEKGLWLCNHEANMK